MTEIWSKPAIKDPRQLRGAELRQDPSGASRPHSDPSSRMKRQLVGILIIALGLATAVATATPQSSDDSYPRVGMPEVRNILLAHTANSWDDWTLAWHLFGSSLNGSDLDSFEQREMEQNAIQAAVERRQEVEGWRNVDRFSLGMVNVDMRGPGLSNAKVRFRRMQGYNENDINHVNLILAPFDFETSTFLLLENLLPCSGSRTQPVEFGHSFKRGDRLGFSPKKWPVASEQLDANCRLHVPDEALARKIETARHRRNLIVGATLRVRLTGEMEGATHLLEVDEIQVDLFTKSALPFRDFVLASFTIPAPSAPEPAPDPRLSETPADEVRIAKRGLDLNDPAQLSGCSTLAALTFGMAEQAATQNIPANRTEIYNSIKAGPHLGEMAEPTADMMARVVDRLGGRMTPRMILAWSMYGYCHGFEEHLLFGEAATKVGAACNATPEGTEDQCIRSFTEAEFKELPLDVQNRTLEDARQRGY